MGNCGKKKTLLQNSFSVMLFFLLYMYYSIDLGGSTVDIVQFSKGTYVPICSLESSAVNKSSLENILHHAHIFDISKVSHLVLTGGHHRSFSDDFQGIPLKKVDEIQAIARGAAFLTREKEALVCSLGTGTCCVLLQNEKGEHAGGTGIGGGTFLGLCRTLLGEDDFSVLRDFVSEGDLSGVDLSVEEIVGGDIGMVPKEATAANFAKADSKTSSADLACGVANMVGQTIASVAIFLAKAHDQKTIILGGKLLRLPGIVEVLQKTASIYDRTLIIPQDAGVMSAVGAGS